MCLNWSYYGQLRGVGKRYEKNKESKERRENKMITFKHGFSCQTLIS